MSTIDDNEPDMIVSIPRTAEPRFPFLRRYRTLLVAAGIVIVFALVGTAIYHLTSEVKYDDVIAALQATPWSDIALALVFTALSFLCLICYDLNAFRYLGRKVPFAHVALTAFSAYAVGNTAGFGALSGGAIRYRAYSRLDVPPDDITRIVAFVTLAFGLGLSAVSSLAGLLVAEDVAPLLGMAPWLLRALSLIILVALAGLVFYSRDGRELRIGGATLTLPDAGTCLRQFVITLADIAASATVLYVLLPDTHLSWPAFLAIYAIAVGFGVLSHVPAGLGVFETVIIASLGSSADVEAVLGSLVLYRVIYHVLPLIIAIAIVLTTEVRQLTHHPAASSIRRLGGRVSPLLLATLSVICGVMLIFSSVTPTPDDNLAFLARYLPLPIVESAHFLSSLLGLTLVIAARGIGQRLDGAWWVVVGASLVALAFSLLKAIALFEAALLLFLAVSLFLTRRLFRRPASLFQQALTPPWLMAMGIVIIGAVCVLLFVYRDVEYSHDLWWQFEFTEEAPRSLRAVLGIVIMSSAVAIFGLLRPARQWVHPATPDELRRAAEIVEKQDVADANLVRMGDKSLLFSEKGDAFIMFGVQGRSWICLFDPVGNPKSYTDLVWRFVESARAAGCRAVFYQVSPALLSHCADAGLRAFKLGELAIVHLKNFEMKGGKWANLRQTASKAVRDGLDFEIIETADVPQDYDELKEVSDAWLGHHNTREKGFSLGAFDRDYVLSQPVAVLRVEGRIVAFANLLVTDTLQEGSIDLMRFSPDAPKGSMDFLFVRIIEHLRDKGFQTFNLGMAPLSGMSKRSVSPVWDRVGGALFEHGERFYNFKGLRAFKAKFHPEWEPRYLAVSGGLNPVLALMDSALLIGGGVRGVVGK